MLVTTAIGSFLATLAICSGTTEASELQALDGNSVVALAVFLAVAFSSRQILIFVPHRIYWWAVPLGLGLATAEFAGISLLSDAADLHLLRPSWWGFIHWSGTSFIAILGFALVFHLADRNPVTDRHGHGLLANFIRELRTGTFPFRPLSLLFGLIALSRVPNLIICWPGILKYDTYRSIAYGRGIARWSEYEPIGHSLLITTWDALSRMIGIGDTAALAFASIIQLITTSFAFTFMLWRCAVWGAKSGLWIALLGWVVLVPALSFSSITIVKDVPFTTAFIFFLVAIVEISRTIKGGTTTLWPWTVLFLGGAAMIALRNNGSYVVLLGTLALLIPFWNQRRRLIGCLIGFFLVFLVFSRVIPAYLDASSSPQTEMLSVPLQQVARIVVDHGTELSQQDQEFVRSLFDDWTFKDIAENYDPSISDPIKGKASQTWNEHGGDGFVQGWLRLVAEYPASAITATLANTVGYWAPGAPSWDGIDTASTLGVYDIWLDLPESNFERLVGKEWLESTGQKVPVLGMVLSPGAITWVWILSLAILVRKRAFVMGSFMVPSILLMLTILAGPVSGGLRYSLGFYAALPIAVTIALLTPDGRHSNGGSGDLSSPGADVKW